MTRFPMRRADGVLLLLLASAAALVAALFAVPDSYSWIEHTTSESAAQGIDGAWVARLGFVLLGLAVLWLASMARDRWGRAGTMLHRCFGVSMIAVAAFSARPWLPDAPFDRTEDVLHSVGSFTVGVGFVAGVLFVTAARPSAQPVRRTFDVAAAVAACGAVIAMGLADDIAGALQRLPFLAAYLWYAAEALAEARSQGDGVRSAPTG